MDQEQDEVHGNRYSQYRSVCYLFPCPGFFRGGWSLSLNLCRTVVFFSKSHNGIKSRILIGKRSEAFSVELRVEKKLSDIVSHLHKHNNYFQIVTKFSTMSF